jgi:hypothetical protein
MRQLFRMRIINARTALIDSRQPTYLAQGAAYTLGLRVNCTALASARNSRWRDTADLIRRPKNTDVTDYKQCSANRQHDDLQRRTFIVAATGTAEARAPIQFLSQASDHLYAE